MTSKSKPTRSATAKHDLFEARWPDLQWGCAPKPATEPGCCIFRIIEGFEHIVEIGAISKHFGGHWGFILGPLGPPKTRFSCGECCIFRKIEGFETSLKLERFRSILGVMLAPLWDPPGVKKQGFRLMLASRGAFFRAFWVSVFERPCKEAKTLICC